MSDTSAPTRMMKIRIVKWVLLVLLLAYVVQYLQFVFYKGGQSRMGEAFEIIGHETFRRQYDGSNPQMRVIGAGASPTLCTWWNFEQTWGHGRCVSVGLDVRDYRPEYQPIVAREVKKLGLQLSQPCVLLPTLKLPNEAQLAHALDCGADKKPFKLRIWVNTVTVTNEQGLPHKPNRWAIADRKHLNSYHFKGEL